MCESARCAADLDAVVKQTPYRSQVALESEAVTAIGPPANTAPSNVSSRCPPPGTVPCHRRSPPEPLLSVSPVTVTVVAPPPPARSTTIPSTTAAVEHAVAPPLPVAMTVAPFGAVNASPIVPRHFVPAPRHPTIFVAPVSTDALPDL